MSLAWTTAEVWRVLKPGAHLVAFGAPRGYHRMACAIEDAGFEIRDSLMWIFGTGFPKSHDVSLSIDKESGAIGHLSKSFNMKGGGDRSDEFIDNGRDFSIKHVPATEAAAQWEGFGTALKPAFEPIILARKPMSEKTVAANVLKWGTGALNIDGCRVQMDGADRSAYEEKRKSFDGVAGKVCGNTVAMNASALETSSAAIARSSEGRWPANVCHDGSAEVVEAFPRSKDGVAGKRNAANGEVLKSGLGAYDKEWGGYGGEGSAARFFYSAKANKTDRAGSKHPTIKPVSLMEWLCKLITPPGGVVLDPFAGSGTTLQAAVQNGFKAIGVEREAEYVQDIQRRMLQSR